MGRRSGGINYQGASGFWRQDDRSGFTVRAYSTRQEWTGLIVNDRLWEPRQPQDLVKGVKDDQTVRYPRPIAPYVWDGPLYYQVSSNVALGATFIPLSSIAGLSAGDSIGVMTDLGSFFNATISGAPTSTGVNISAPMPYTAASGNSMVNYSGQ